MSSPRTSHQAEILVYPRPGVPVTEDQLESVGDTLDQGIQEVRRELEMKYGDLVEIEVTVYP